MSLHDWILIVQLAASGYLAGVIWLIQVVHYPMLGDLNPGLAGDACRRHARRITPVVGVPMLIEGLCALWLIIPVTGRAGGLLLPWAGFVTVGLLWVITFFVQVPQHSRLAQQKGSIDHQTVAQLVRWNWLRTALWTFRVCLSAVMLGLATPPVGRH